MKWKAVFTKNSKRLAALFILSGLIITIPYFYNNNLYGDKKDILREIDSNSRNKLVMNDTNSLNMALAVQKAIRNVAKSVSPSVVNIRTERIVKRSRSRRRRAPFDFFDFFGDDFGSRGPQKLQSLGSGFVISKKGYIVTNNHVVQDADKITILFSNEKEYKGKIIGRDRRTDIAVIKINPKHDLPITPLGDSDKVSIGDFAIAIGNPFGLKGTFTLGVISARGRDNIDVDAGLKNYIQTDASINQGNSGGPLLNIQGQAIGMNAAIYSTTGGSVGIGFAIPMNIVKRVVRSLIEKGIVERGYLGVTISQIPKDVAKYLNVDKRKGIFVQDVEDKGPADRAGIKAGDVILKIDNKEVHSVSQVQRTVSSYKNGDSAIIQILRKGKKKNIKVILGEIKDNKVAKTKKNYSGTNKEFLGLVVGSVKNHYKYFRLNRNIRGLIIIDLEANSPAELSGLKPGDVIQSINYTDINSMTDYKRFVRANKNKKGSFFIKVKRRGRNHFVVVKNK